MDTLASILSLVAGWAVVSLFAYVLARRMKKVKIDPKWYSVVTIYLFIPLIFIVFALAPAFSGGYCPSNDSCPFFVYIGEGTMNMLNKIVGWSLGLILLEFPIALVWHKVIGYPKKWWLAILVPLVFIAIFVLLYALIPVDLITTMPLGSVDLD